MAEPEHRPTRRRRRTILGGVAVVLVVALAALTAPDEPGVQRAARGELVTGQAATAALLDGVPQDGRFLGAPDAPVTLVEFADLQCPFCRDFARDALPTVIRDQVRTGKVRLEFRPRTFLGPDSKKAAKLVVAAGRQDKLWNVLDLLYVNQGEENAGWVTDDLTSRVFRAAGVDPVRARETAPGDGVARDLRDAELLATRNGLDSTPAFLIGPTEGELAPLPVQALTGEFFSAAIDAAAAAT